MTAHLPPSVSLAACEEILRECFRDLSHLPNASLVEDAGIVGAMTDVPIAFFNGVGWTRTSDDDAIDRTVARFQREGRAFRWWITPSSEPQDLIPRLERHGLRFIYDSRGMAADMSRVDFSPLERTSLEIRQVTDEPALREWARVLTSVFQRSAEEREAWARAYLQRGLRDSPWAQFIGSVDGVTIATSTVLMCGPLAGIYHIATMPEARGRGAGAAMTLVAMRHAFERGATVAALQASEMGESVYRSIGYDDVCKLTMYEWRP